MNRLVSVFELDPVPTQGDELRFRIEVFRSLDGGYYARLFRWETFRLEPASSSVGHSDEGVLVEDSFWDWEKQRVDSEVQALTDVLEALQAQLQSEPLSEQVRRLLHELK